MPLSVYCWACNAIPTTLGFGRLFMMVYKRPLIHLNDSTLHIKIAAALASTVLCRVDHPPVAISHSNGFRAASMPTAL